PRGAPGRCRRRGGTGGLLHRRHVHRPREPRPGRRVLRPGQHDAWPRCVRGHGGGLRGGDGLAAQAAGGRAGGGRGSRRRRPRRHVGRARRGRGGAARAPVGRRPHRCTRRSPRRPAGGAVAPGAGGRGLPPVRPSRGGARARRHGRRAGRRRGGAGPVAWGGQSVAELHRGLGRRGPGGGGAARGARAGDAPAGLGGRHPRHRRARPGAAARRYHPRGPPHPRPMRLHPLPRQPEGVPWPTEEWPEGEVPVGVDLEPLVARALDDEGPLAVTYAIVVVHRGRLVAERYHGALEHFDRPPDPVTVDTPLLSWSMAKSMLHAVVGLLVNDGRLDLDAPAAVPEWASRDDPRQAITLRHLLAMRDGLDFVEDYVDDRISDVITMLFGDGQADMAHFAADRGLAAEPGTRFNYSSGTSNIVSGIVARLLG